MVGLRKRLTAWESALVLLVIVLGISGPGNVALAQVPEFAGAAQQPASAKSKQIAVLAGGCFWGVDAVFKHVRGVKGVVSGYAGGTTAHPTYEQVSSGATGHAESVKITYDPSQISYAELLRIFFSVAHDPTELNRQGPDHGTNYRSAIFYVDDEQKQIAEAYIKQLNDARVFPAPIVTQVAPLEHFYDAEWYHQNYLAQHPDEPYIVHNDLPKLGELRKEFPDIYKK
jgi:peptide-methionine (S)-S-oxide reductase